jgi:hypothetical protein
MRVGEFAGPGDIEPAKLAAAVFFDLVDGVDPDDLVRFLVERIELPLDEAQALVGNENGRLQATMHGIADRLEERRERPEMIVADLVEQGWPAAMARPFVGRMQQELAQLARTTAGRDQLLAKARRGMQFGILWFAGGAFATWITGYAAEHGNGSYQLLAWGPIIYGMVLFGYSAFRWCRFKLAAAPTLT